MVILDLILVLLGVGICGLGMWSVGGPSSAWSETAELWAVIPGVGLVALGAALFLAAVI